MCAPHMSEQDKQNPHDHALFRRMIAPVGFRVILGSSADTNATCPLSKIKSCDHSMKYGSGRMRADVHHGGSLPWADSPRSGRALSRGK